MASPAPPSNVTPTVDANDQITLTWDYDPTWFAFDGDDGSLGGFGEGMWHSADAVDHFEIQFSRDGIGYKDPSGGPTSVTHDGSTSYSGTYGPNSDNAYGTQVGIDSMFKFRVRAVNADGASDWTASGKVYTQPISPHNPSINRPSSNEIEVNWTTKSDITTTTQIQIREDTGSGYGSWNHASPNGESNPPATFTVSDGHIQEDTRYQIRLREYQDANNESEYVYADYGNANNVYFSDDFESGDFSGWDSTPTTDDYTYVGTDLQGYSSGVAAEPDPPEGSYGAQISDGKGVTANLGDLSAESDVIVKAYVQSASLDGDTENNAINWHDGSSWTTLETFGHEHNKQGWVEVTTLVPDSLLTTDCKVRFAQGNGSGGYGDHFFVDRVVVSDILHEYTKPAAPSGMSLDSSIDREVTATWTNNATFKTGVDKEHKKTSVSSWVDGPNDIVTSYTWTGLNDGEAYDFRVMEYKSQYRNGSQQTDWWSNWLTGIATTILPAPSNPSASAASDTSLDVSWVDESNNEDGFRVYYRETGASSWNQFSDLASNTESETITSLTQDTEYEFKVENYTEHVSTDSSTDSAITFLNELRSSTSHSSTGVSSSIRVIDLLEAVFSYGTAGASNSIRVVDLLEGVTSASTPIRSQTSRLVDLFEGVTSHSNTLGSSSVGVIDLGYDVNSHARSGNSTSSRLVDLLAATLSHSNTAGSTNTRSAVNFEGRTSDVSFSTSAVSSSLRVVDLLEGVTSSSSISRTASSRGSLNYEGRESDVSFSDTLSSTSLRVVDLLESVNSHAKKSESFVYNNRTSLELIDHQVTWNDGEAVWYTDWFQEKKITGSEDQLAIRSLVVDDSKEPAATVVVQYDSDGDGEVDAESDPIRLGRNQTVEDITGIPIDEDGFYRLRISEYSGYNSLYAIDTGIVN